MVADPGFDPSSTVILERDPGLSSAPGSDGTGSARFAWRSDNAAEVEVDSPGPAVVLVRNAYDSNWRATVDGRPAPVLAADYLLQGVPVGPGHHSIVLSYRDRSIGLGLLGSALALLALLAGALALRIRRPPFEDRPSAGPLAEQEMPVAAHGLEPARIQGRVDFRRLVRFGVVSVIATVVDFGIFNLLVIPKLLSPVVATTISYSAGTVASYFLNKWFTFRGGRDSVVHEFGLFVLINVVGLAMNNGAVALVAHAMGDNTLLLNLAKLAAGAATWALKFLTFKRWVFPEQRPAAASPHRGSA